MPITPFHFGPGALIHAIAPRHASFLSFCAANVLIDIESAVNLLTRRYPVHAFLHTYIGATLIVALTVAVFLISKRLAAKVVPGKFQKFGSLPVRSIGIGAALGAYSHILLDSVMHHDIRPLSPVSEQNSLLGVVGLGPLHLFCIVTGVVALAILAIRRLMARRRIAA